MDNSCACNFIIVRLVDRTIVYESTDPSDIANRMWGVDGRAYHVYASLEPLPNDITSMESKIRGHLKRIKEVSDA